MRMGSLVCLFSLKVSSSCCLREFSPHQHLGCFLGKKISRRCKKNENERNWINIKRSFYHCGQSVLLNREKNNKDEQTYLDFNSTESDLGLVTLEDLTFIIRNANAKNYFLTSCNDIKIGNFMIVFYLDFHRVCITVITAAVPIRTHYYIITHFPSIYLFTYLF